MKDYFRKAESDIINTGWLSLTSKGFFESMSKLKDDRLGPRVLELSKYTKDWKKMKEQDPEKYKDFPDVETCKAMMLKLIKQQIEHFESFLQDAIKTEKERFAVDKAILLVSTDATSVKAQRYETGLIRRMDKKIDQLQKLHDRRCKCNA